MSCRTARESSREVALRKVVAVILPVPAAVVLEAAVQVDVPPVLGLE